MDENYRPRIGQFVQILQGRDQGKIALIIAVLDERFVLIAEGNKRRFDKPKKKNVKHLALYDEISEEVVSSMLQNGRVTNKMLRFACNQFIENRPINAEKGD